MSIDEIRKNLKTKGFVYLQNFIPFEKLDPLHLEAIAIGQKMGFLTSNKNRALLKKDHLQILHSNQIDFALQLKKTSAYDNLLKDLQVCLNFDLIFKDWHFHQPGLKDAGVWARFVGPASHNPTLPAHQDGDYQQKNEKIFGVWFPLTDCPKTLGGLSLLPKSHKKGLRPHSKDGFLRHKIGKDWFSTDFKKGDCLIFSNYTIHKPFDNLTKNQARLSVDWRIKVSGKTVSELRPSIQC